MTGIEIFHGRSQKLLKLSHKALINKVLERLEQKQLESAPYACVVGSLMYAQT